MSALFLEPFVNIRFESATGLSLEVPATDPLEHQAPLPVVVLLASVFALLFGV